MTWEKLSPAELEAVRKSLHLSVKEASQWIAGHATPRTWQKYEEGVVGIPADVDTELYALSQHAETVFDVIHEQAVNAHENEQVLQLHYYRNENDWIAEHGQEHPVNWRIHQSVVARIFNEFGSSVSLV